MTKTAGYVVLRNLSDSTPFVIAGLFVDKKTANEYMKRNADTYLGTVRIEVEQTEGVVAQ